MATIQQRKTSDGDVRYRAFVRLKGQPVRTRTFRRKTDAKRWAQQAETDARRGVHLRRHESERRTFSELLSCFREELRVRLDHPSFVRRDAQLAWWEQALGAYALANIRPAMIADLRRRLRQGEGLAGKPIGPASANRYLAALSTAFSYAVELEWMDSNPVRRVRRDTEPRGRVRFLDADEQERLLDACGRSTDARLHLLVLLALHTGARQAELLGLRWRDLDLENHCAIIEDTKNGERRSIPIVGSAHQALEARAAEAAAETPGSDAWVFAGKRGRPSFNRQAWLFALEDAGIENFRFHDLRHTAASYLAMSGRSLVEIADFLGHKTLAMVKRYSHLTEGHKVMIARDMAKRFLR